MLSNKLDVTGDNTKDYSLTINVTEVPSSAISFIKEMNVDGSGTTGYGASAGKILWNFGSQVCDVTFNKEDGGVVLAPNGSVKVTQSHNGSIYAKTVENSGCEIHQNGFRKVTDTSTSAILSVKKAVTGDTAPTPAETFNFTLAAVDNAPMPAAGGEKEI